MKIESEHTHMFPTLALELRVSLLTLSESENRQKDWVRVSRLEM